MELETILTTGILVCAVVLTVHILSFIKARKQKKANKEVVDDNATAESLFSTSDSQSTSDEKLKHREFLLTTLKSMGCQPIVGERNSSIFLKYQGEAFCIVQDRSFIRIWDLPYSEVNVLDTNLPLIIESINSANFSLGPTIVISKPDENGNREIQSRMDLIFLPTLPHPDKYLSKIFDLFFDIKIRLKTEISRWNTPEAQNQPSSLTVFPFQN